MKLGKVIGNVVSTKKVENINSLKILVVRYLNEEMQETKTSAACIDTVSAGEGDIVLLCSSSSARLTEMTKSACIDNTIVGIVDSVSSNNKYIYKKTDL
ncbi:MAG: EutN/CcmL family microcompartment protein [Bacteroidota bacterium]